MSLNLLNASARLDFGASPPTLAELTFVLWLKPASAVNRRGLVCLSTHTGGDVASHFIIRLYDGTINFAHRNASVAPNVYFGSVGTGWQVAVCRAQGGAVDTLAGKRNGEAEITETLSGSNPAAAMRYLTLGRWLPNDDTSYLANGVKLLLAIYRKRLNNTQRDAFWNGGNSAANPLAIDPGELIVWFDGTSLASAVGGWTLTELNGTVGIDGADNPTIDAPPSGGGNVDLEGEAKGQATAAAAAAIAKPLGGAAAAQATPAGTLAGSATRAFRMQFHLRPASGPADEGPPAANVSGLHVRWWRSFAASLTEPPEVVAADAALDAAGWLELAAPADLAPEAYAGWGVVTELPAEAGPFERQYSGPFYVGAAPS